MLGQKSLLLLGLSAIGIASAGYLIFSPNRHLAWPQTGQVDAIIAMDKVMISHDCSPEMEVWENDPELGSKYLYADENRICSNSYVNVGWHATEASVTGIFRCDLDERFAEYALTVYRHKENVFGATSCQYILRESVADQGVGLNLEYKLPEPGFSVTGFNTDEILFSTVNN